METNYSTEKSFGGNPSPLAQSKSLNVDAALKTLGGLSGRFQRLLLVMLSIVELPCAWMYLMDVFTTAIPTHHCRTLDTNITAADAYRAKPTGDEVMGEWVTEGECSMRRHINVSHSNVTINRTAVEIRGCSRILGWTYIYSENAPMKSSIVSEWNLVCDQSHLVPLITTIFFAGDMVGGLVLTTLSDIFGRKKIFIASTALVLPFALGTAFANDYITFVAMRFCTAIFINGSFLTSWTLLLEYLLSSERAVGTQVIDIFWAVGLMSLAGISYALQNWRHLLILSAACYLPITLVMLWMMPESVHYLIAKGKLAEAEAVIVRIAKFNKIQLPRLHLEGAIPMNVVDDHNSAVHSNQSNNRPSTLFNILTTRNLRLQAAMACFVWFVNALVYYGLSLNSTKMAGNQYLNFFIVSAVEIPAYIVCAITLHYCKRRWPICMFHIVAGLALMLLLVLPHADHVRVGVELTLVTVGKLGITAAFAGIYMYTPELYPTVVRNSALGLMSICSRVGAMIAPQSQNFVSPLTTPILFGSLAMAAAIIIMLLPETSRRPLPETLDEVAHTWKRMKA